MQFYTYNIDIVEYYLSLSMLGCESYKNKKKNALLMFVSILVLITNCEKKRQKMLFRNYFNIFDDKIIWST